MFSSKSLPIIDKTFQVINTDVVMTDLEEIIVLKNYSKLPDGVYNSLLSVIGDVGEFPVTPNLEPEESIKIDIDTLKNVYKACGNNDLRPFTMGIFFDAENRTMVATDSHVIKVRKSETFTRSVIIPKFNMTKLDALVKEFKDVLLSINDEYAIFHNDFFSYSKKLIKENFPNYMRIIPNELENPKIINLEQQLIKNMVSTKKDAKFANIPDVYTIVYEDEVKMFNADFGFEKYFPIVIEQSESLVIDKTNIDLVMPVIIGEVNIGGLIGLNINSLEKMNASKWLFTSPDKALIGIPTQTTYEAKSAKKSPVMNKKQDCNITQVKKQKSNEVKFLEYSEKSFALIGEQTKQIKDKLKEYGNYNRHLKCGAGWIFSNKKKDDVLNLLSVENFFVK